MEIANTSGDLSQVNSYTPYYLQYNWHGDAVTVVDPDGAGGNQGNAYDPWGNGATPQASGRNYYGWNGGFGYQYFSALGMYYVHGRWYDPNVGRFISPDEKGEYLYGSGEDAVNWVWSAGQDAYCQFVSDETLGLPAALDQLLQYITNGERVSGYTTMCIENQGGDAFNFGAAFGRGTSYALSVVEIVGGIDMIVGGGVGGAVTCPVTFGGGCAARAGAVAVGAAGVVHGGAVIVRNLHAPILRAQGRGFDDVLSDDETFMRWLVRGHPVDRPLSESQARAVWDKLLQLGLNPRFDLTSQIGTYSKGPHINVQVGGSNIHIPVAAGFRP
jgi:RHS repeat-associated protein